MTRFLYLYTAPITYSRSLRNMLALVPFMLSRSTHLQRYRSVARSYVSTMTAWRTENFQLQLNGSLLLVSRNAGKHRVVFDAVLQKLERSSAHPQIAPGSHGVCQDNLLGLHCAVLITTKRLKYRREYIPSKNSAYLSSSNWTTDEVCRCCSSTARSSTARRLRVITCVSFFMS